MQLFNVKKSFSLTLLYCIISLLFSIIPILAAPYYGFSYDVIIIGSDPEGISAAISSARNGSRVLLVDTRSDVGGLYTSGMLSMLDMNYIAPNTFQTVNAGFFKEFYDETADSANIDIPKTKKYFTNLLQKEKVDRHLGVSDITPIKQDNKVVGLSYTKAGNTFHVKGKVFIDASRDAKFARASGVPYNVGREELGMKNEYAAATLVFSVKGADWPKIKAYLNTDNSIYTGATAKTAWGYPNMLSYTPSSSAFQLRRLNLSLQDDGSVVINAFQIFNTDSLDENNIHKNYQAAVKELPAIVKYLNQEAIGFENAVLHQYADELYIREGVRIIGEYTLTGEDLFNNINFKDKIAYGSYPMDLQATRRDRFGGTILSSRNIYTIPITIMVPKLIDNLLIVGRSASYDPLAHSSARTVPVGMALGQAAGILASYSIDHSLSVRTCSLDSSHVRNIQTVLIASGVTLDTPLNTIHPEKSSWAYPYIVSLRKKAFLSMEYDFKNDYRCRETATFETLSRILTLIQANSSIKLPAPTAPSHTHAALTPWQIVSIFNHLLNTHHKDLNALYHADIIDYNTFIHIDKKKVLLNEDLYAMMSGLIDYIMP
ncbi:FAD-dependent oxidoreductase [Cellulosilyticum sp. I15G10I2]|uniref:FAD-dependent oxidoreductase n=1 Tax=Cellulosilyticum sp. I15G10I2 TaxID=1892843 RepID=UPI00085C8CE6|nr:FAD-dependent oxidoreductase [Cellulosilyticum sp. I15G10I2]